MVGATLQIYDLRDPNDTAPIFTKMAGDRVEALIAFPDSVIFGQRDNIVQTALRRSLPGVYLYREWVAAGGLLAYGPNQASILGGPLPIMVDKIIKGAKPGDLPVEHGKLELFVNPGQRRRCGSSCLNRYCPVRTRLLARRVPRRSTPEGHRQTGELLSAGLVQTKGLEVALCSRM